MSGLRCGDQEPITHTIRGMCLHEHLLEAHLCAQHAAFVARELGFDLVSCSECHSAGYPQVPFQAVIKPLTDSPPLAAVGP